MVRKSKDICQVVQRSKPVKQEKVMVASKIAKVRIGQYERIFRDKLGIGTFSVYLLQITICNFQFYFMSELVTVREEDTGYIGGKRAVNKELSFLLKISLLDFILCMYIVYVYIFIYVVYFPVMSSFICEFK